MMPLTYRKAGVDVEGADAWLARMAPVIRATHGAGVLRDQGRFAGLFHLAALSLKDPVLVASTDGVGTKVRLAQLVDPEGRGTAHEGIGVDAVAMNVNDVLVYGARPILFLDYLAVGTLQPRLMSRLLRGVARGCRMSGCALLGGETAEMPGVYGRGEYDLAGFCVGVVERTRLLTGSRVASGDAVVGLASSGVHANGFSLVRRVFTRAQMVRLRRELLVPTRIYVAPVLEALRRVAIRAIAHVTGGGLSRRLPALTAGRPGLRVALTPGSWRVPEIFARIQAAGRLSMQDMMGTFNMGIGMAVVCPASDASRLVAIMQRAGIAAWRIGRLEHR